MVRKAGESVELVVQNGVRYCPFRGLDISDLHFGIERSWLVHGDLPPGN
jgi:hypothetical protein